MLKHPPCPGAGKYEGPGLSVAQLARIFMSSTLRGRKINDPDVHKEMRDHWCGGARRGHHGAPCLMWMSERRGIVYEVDHDGVERTLTWSELASLDPGQPDLLGELTS